MEVPSLYDQGVHLQGEGMRHSRGLLLYRYHESELGKNIIFPDGEVREGLEEPYLATPGLEEPRSKSNFLSRSFKARVS